MVRVRIKREKNNKALANLKRAMNDLKSVKLKVGWFDSAKYDDGAPVAGIAAIQEFGSTSRGIPPRPFFRPVIAENENGWGAYLKREIKKSIDNGSSVVDVFDKLGLRITGEVRKSISNVYSPELSPITLALRRLRREGVEITGSTVGQVARAIKEGKTGPGELGNTSGVSDKPLVDEGVLIATATHVVEAN